MELIIIYVLVARFDCYHSKLSKYIEKDEIDQIKPIILFFPFVIEYLEKPTPQES